MNDAVGSHTGTLHSVQVGQPGYLGTAYGFGGSGYVSVPSAADLNPGTSPTATDNVFKPTATSSAVEMKLANSNNHDKDGQNVLYGDGHVEFQSNPFCGVQRDNIFARRGSVWLAIKK